jgi:hypothetical protein
MRFEKIAEKSWTYTLYKGEDGAIVLSVVCGGVGMYELNIPLDHDTASKAIADEVFLAECASDIRDHPERYAGRSIRV